MDSGIGYRFHPTDEELVNHYLRLKMLGYDDRVQEIPEVNVLNFEPWQLPDIEHPEAVISNNSNDQVWYFFCPRNYKYSNSNRANRTTNAGYWKVTGKDRKINENGIKKTLVFYQGRPKGSRPIGSCMSTIPLSASKPSRPDFKYSNGKRANRTTRAGFWKATGKIRYIKAGESRKEIGSKRTLVFHKKVHDSKPVRTNWIIHEYQSKNILPNQRHFVLCKLKQKVDENIDHSPEDEGEPSRPTDAQTDPEQVLQSQICIMGMHPEGLNQQGVSDEHLLQTNCFDNPHMGLDLHDTSDEDPIKLADSFLSLDDECFTQKNADVPPNDYRPPEPLRKTYVADIHWKTASGYSESPQPTKTSNLNDGDASSEEYQQMQTVLTPTETLTSGEGKNDPYRKEVSVTGTSTAGSAADRPFEINYIRYAYKPGVCRGIASFSSVVTRDKSFEDMENCLSGQGQDRCYCLPEINRNESVGEEFPKPQKRLMISNFTGQKLNPSTVSTGEVTNLSCSYMTSKEPEKPGLNLKSTRSSDNDREGDADSSLSDATLTRYHKQQSSAIRA
ncbi:hypothetical protein GH714_021901 [Hevea brasiliensis]|uniref:NAC domain-containing protein n=1 Tax=Hevea brasiliensis TaxID=3981 RepID=A0A6A6NIB1_HEVBR|nr:hypothetical protein GH714_021901 [Hevea brasiliensis]